MSVFDRIRDILTQELALKPGAVTMSSNLRQDFGADSMDALQIISAIEETFGIELVEEEALKLNSVADIVDLVTQQLKEKSP